MPAKTNTAQHPASPISLYPRQIVILLRGSFSDQPKSPHAFTRAAIRHFVGDMSVLTEPQTLDIHLKVLYPACQEDDVHRAPRATSLRCLLVERTVLAE